MPKPLSLALSSLAMLALTAPFGHAQTVGDLIRDSATFEPPPASAPRNVATRERTPDPSFNPGDFVIAANTAVFSPEPYLRGRHDARMAKLQVLLDRTNVSPGVIDGYFGGNVSKAIGAAEMMAGLPVDGILDPTLWAVLERGAPDTFVSYEITAEDVAGPFVPEMPSDYAEMAKLERTAYRNPVEGLAERFHMDEDFLRALNPEVSFETAGSTIIVANVGSNTKTKVMRIVADKTKRQLLGFDSSDALVVAYPATIGSSDLPSPTGTHAVMNIAVNPEYWYRPQVNFQQGTNTKALRLPPGPNNPVGAVWIGLDKPTYGIHGSPEPSKIDKTNSHGCVRLANWDAQELVKLVAPGVSVEFLDSRVDLTSAE